MTLGLRLLACVYKPPFRLAGFSHSLLCLPSHQTTVASRLLYHINFNFSEQSEKKVLVMDERKLFVVLGITGKQGGSVARTFLNDPAMKLQYRLRGVTRDPSSSRSRELTAQGVEMVSADLHDPPSLLKAFSGTHAIFSVTDFWAPYFDPNNQTKAHQQGKTIGQLAYEMEYEQGRNIADAASQISSLERLVISMVCSAKKSSNSRYDKLWHFDSKADMISYLKSTYPALAAKTSQLNMGVFMQSWKSAPIVAPRRTDDGVHLLTLPCNPNTPIPFVDPNNDTGLFVRALLTLEPGVQLYGETALISWNAWLTQWGKIMGKEVKFERVSVEFFEEELSKTFPPGFGTEIGEMFEFMGEYGYNGGDPACKRKEEVRTLELGRLGSASSGY